MTEHPHEHDLDRLQTVLEIYGAEPGRWPEADRERLLRQTRESDAARRLLREAEALEQVMAHASGGKAPDGLGARIVAAAVHDPAREARVVPIGAASARRSRRGAFSGNAMAAGLLAASFALGLYVGLAGLAQPAVEGALNYASLGGIVEAAENPFSLSGGLTTDAEDLL